MKVLLVYAHPEPTSFNGSLRDVAVETLTDAGHEVRVSDLYSLGFNAVAGPADVVARYGGEEFAIVLEETDAEGAQLLCERVRQQVAAQVMNSDKGAFRVTVSLGIASYPEDGVEKHHLVERADQALYAAKEGGRNRTVRFDQQRLRLKGAVGMR